MRSNHQIRKAKRDARKQIPDEDRYAFNKLICQRIIATPEYQQASSIAGFRAFDGEVDLADVYHQAWLDDKQLYLPAIVQAGSALLFVPWYPDDSLIVADFGIERPDRDAASWIKGSAIDLVLTPLVAFTDKLHRLGMGAGFYDRTFAGKLVSHEHEVLKPTKPVLLGVAYECQRIENMLINQWDVPLDGVLTEQQWYTQHQERADKKS